MFEALEDDPAEERYGAQAAQMRVCVQLHAHQRHVFRLWEMQSRVRPQVLGRETSQTNLLPHDSALDLRARPRRQDLPGAFQQFPTQQIHEEQERMSLFLRAHHLGHVVQVKVHLDLIVSVEREEHRLRESQDVREDLVVWVFVRIAVVFEDEILQRDLVCFFKSAEHSAAEFKEELAAGFQLSPGPQILHFLKEDGFTHTGVTCDEDGLGLRVKDSLISQKIVQTL